MGWGHKRRWQNGERYSTPARRKTWRGKASLREKGESSPRFHSRLAGLSDWLHRFFKCLNESSPEAYLNSLKKGSRQKHQCT